MTGYLVASKENTILPVPTQTEPEPPPVVSLHAYEGLSQFSRALWPAGHLGCHGKQGYSCVIYLCICDPRMGSQLPACGRMPCSYSGARSPAAAFQGGTFSANDKDGTETLSPKSHVAARDRVRNSRAVCGLEWLLTISRSLLPRPIIRPLPRAAQGPSQVRPPSQFT